MGKTAIIYARVSDKKQVENDLSLPGQLEACRHLAEDMGVRIVREYEEKGRSAWHGTRPEFEAAIAFCVKNHIDYFICWDTARFSRDTTHGPLHRAQLRAAGTTIKYLTIDIDPNTDAGFILEAVLAMTDEIKSRKTSADTRRSMIRNAEAGYFNGGNIPLGYEVGPALDNPKRRRLYINPDEAPTVKAIFQLALDGAGGTSIALDMNDRGLLNRGRRWNKCSIVRLLRNHTVTGVRVFGKRDRNTLRRLPESEWIVSQAAEPIITREGFDMVKKQLDTRSSPRDAGSPRSKWLFTGLLKCGKCGASMQIETGRGRSGKRFSYYNCRNNQKHKTCERRTLRADELDAWLTDEIVHNMFTPRMIAGIIVELNKHMKKHRDTRGTRMAELSSGITRAVTERERIYDAIAGGQFTADYLSPRLDRACQQIERLERELTDIKLEPPPTRELTDEDADEIYTYLVEMVKSPQNPQRVRQYFATFIQSVVVEDDAITINYIPEMVVSTDPDAVHSRVQWLPERALLGTRTLRISLPDQFIRAA